MSDTKRGFTGREMCDFVADWIGEKTGKRPDPVAIWNISPTGELWPVFELFDRAVCERKNLTCELDQATMSTRFRSNETGEIIDIYGQPL